MTLLDACLRGDVAATTALLDADPEAATRPLGERAWPPLLYVAFARDHTLAPIAQLLLARGADPDSSYTSNGERFPALYAAIIGDLAIARLLVAAGANVNDGQSLYHACERPGLEALDVLAAGSLDAKDVSYCIKHAIDFQALDKVRWFLAHGADPNAVHPQSGEASLHWAIKRASSLELIDFLLAHGADRDQRAWASVYPEIIGATPLDYARRLAREDIVTRLAGAASSPGGELIFAALSGARTEPVDVSTLPPADRVLIAHVAQQNLTEPTLRLARLGWPLDARGWMNATPLHWACCRGNPELVRGLLALGAEPIDVGGYFATPEHTARECQWNRDGDYAEVQRLLGSRTTR